MALLALISVFAGAGAACNGAPGTAAVGVVAAVPVDAAAEGLSGAFVGSAANPSELRERASVVATSNLFIIPPPLLEFVDQFAGKPVEIFISYVGIVHGKSPGNEELGKSEDVSKVDDTYHLDFE